ncbi:MAG TPA: hypothetical protein VGK79_04030 [Gaiellaceae bacterium]
MSALSKIYGTKDERPWYVRFPVSIAIAMIVTAALDAAATVTLGLHMPCTAAGDPVDDRALACDGRRADDRVRRARPLRAGRAAIELDEQLRKRPLQWIVRDLL